MITTITMQMLENMPTGVQACEPALQWFATTFPDGATLEQAWDACPYWQWQVLFAMHSADQKAVAEFEWSRAAAATRAADRAARASEAAATRARAAADRAAADARAADYAAAYAADYAIRAAARASTSAADYARAADDARAAASIAARAAEAAKEERALQIAWARAVLFG